MRAMGVSLPAEDAAPFRWYLVLSIVLPALYEELIYRYVPLVIALRRWEKRWPTFAVLVVSSAYFGWIHWGLPAITLQGVFGVIWSFTFIKCGGAHDRYGKALWASTASHALYNIVAFLFPTFAAWPSQLGLFTCLSWKKPRGVRLRDSRKTSW